VDGDPFSDFATLVRTSLVLRDGIAHHQTDLTTTHAPVVDPTRWLDVARALERNSCCHPDA
ncbi:hypothetical protein, partial [Streptomyces sp.]